jgi:hypothetical protein
MYGEAAKVKEWMKEEGTQAGRSGLENKGRMTQHEGKRNSFKRIWERAGRHAGTQRAPGSSSKFDRTGVEGYGHSVSFPAMYRSSQRDSQQCTE